MKNWYWYERLPEGNVRLLRVFGTLPEVTIPERINGMSVKEIGAYCFSTTNRVKSYEVYAEDDTESGNVQVLQQLCEKGSIRELCGEYLQKIVLPESVVSLGNLACYQCSCLKELVIGSNLTEVGSDAFMNCRNLKNITVNGSVAEPSGLKQILGQRSLETKVTFQTKNRKEAVLIYPEYSESYDEIGPAHIFKLNIEGEGFRARQCFRNGVVDLTQYDNIFMQACAKESEDTLCHMAMMRLYYPIGLHEEKKENYKKYLKDHSRSAGEILIQEKNIKFICFLVNEGCFEKKDMEVCIQCAVEMNWTEGVRELLQCRDSFDTDSRKDEYGFEEF